MLMDLIRALNGSLGLITIFNVKIDELIARFYLFPSLL